MCGGKLGKLNIGGKLIKEFTGVNDQIAATNRNADAQYAATAQATRDQQAALQASAQASADQQSMLAARSAAEEKASQVQSAPLESATVQLDAPTTESSAATRRSRREKFGRSYGSGGVQI